MNKNFKLLMSGQLVSQAGDKIHMIALALWVLKTTGSSGKMGAVLACSLIPGLILGLFSGAVIDRYPRKAIIVGTDIIRGIVLLLFTWLMAKGLVDFYLVLGMQVVLSVNAAFFDPCIPAVLPGIVSQKELARANAIHQSINSFALIAGAALGGMAVAGFGYMWVFALNGASFLISAGFEMFIRIPATKAEKPGQSLIADVRDGYSYLFGSRPLMAVIFMVTAIHFFVGSIEVFMPVIANQLSSRGAETLGVFQAAMGAGPLMMALVLTRLPVAGKEKRTLFSSVIIMGGLQMLSFLLPKSGLPGICGFTIFFFLWSGFMIRAAVSFKTLLQMFAGQAYGGRVFALASTLGNAAIPAAMIVFGLVLEYISPTLLLPVSGLILAGMGGAARILFRS